MQAAKLIKAAHHHPKRTAALRTVHTSVRLGSLLLTSASLAGSSSRSSTLTFLPTRSSSLQRTAHLLLLPPLLQQNQAPLAATTAAVGIGGVQCCGMTNRGWLSSTLQTTSSP